MTPEAKAASVYRGRFAPSPTGPLHFGSLIAATASYLDAHAHNGTWLVRMEDVDSSRNIAGAADHILATLDAFGFEWSGEVLWQSTRSEAYGAELDQLKNAGLAYGCACSRKEIADSNADPALDGGLVYPGTCRAGIPQSRSPRAWRLRVGSEAVVFEDRLQGNVSQQLGRDSGDFVLLRADGLFAYQLAVAVDDFYQGISHVVRGADLLASTPRQIWLQHCLSYPTPSYAHLPVVCNAVGEKLSKQTLAPAIKAGSAAASLVDALRFLGQAAPLELRRARVADVWDWAFENWQFLAIPRCPTIPLA